MWLCFQFYYPREVLTQLYQGTCLRIFLQGFFVCLFFFFALAVAGSQSEPRCVSLGNKQTKCVGCIPWDTRRQQEARSQVPAWLARVLVWAGQAWFLPFAMAYYYSFKIFIFIYCPHWILVMAHRIFDLRCGMLTLSCSVWNLVPSPGIKPRPMHWKHGVLATGPQGIP